MIIEEFALVLTLYPILHFSSEGNCVAYGQDTKMMMTIIDMKYLQLVFVCPTIHFGHEFIDLMS